MPFVDELGTVRWEVPPEYGFESLVGRKQHKLCFLMYNCVHTAFKMTLSSAPGVFAGKHR